MAGGGGGAPAAQGARGAPRNRRAREGTGGGVHRARGCVCGRGRRRGRHVAYIGAPGLPRGDFKRASDDPRRDRTSFRPRKIKRSSDPLVARGRGHNAPRGDTTPCRRVSASERARGRRRDREVRSALTGRAREDTTARSARGRGSASTGGSDTCARSAGARASASTGGCETSARSAGAQPSASTGGSEARARSAGALRSASTGGSEASARSAGAQASASTGGSDAGARSVARLARRPLERSAPPSDSSPRRRRWSPR